MYNASQEFKTAMQAGVKEVDAYLALADDTTITAADDLVSITVEAENSLGQVVMRLLKVELLGNHAELKGQEVQLYVGVKIGADFEYLNYGTFEVTKFKYNKASGYSNIEAYDKMLKLNVQYKASNFTYPATIKQIAEKVCQTCGITLGSTTWPNSTLTINQDRYDGIDETQYRDVIEDIAATTGTIAMIHSDTLIFKTPADTLQSLTGDNLMEYEVQDKYGPINAVVIGRSPQEDNVALKDDTSIAANGLTEWRIDNNQLIDDQRETAITALFNSIKDIEYYPFTAKTEGHAYWEIGDMLTIDTDGTEQLVMITGINLNIDGSIDETIKGEAQTSSGTNYARAGSNKRSQQRTEIIVDKQNGKIEQIASGQVEIDGKVLDLESSIQIEKDRINSTVRDLSGLTNRMSNTEQTLAGFTDTITTTVEAATKDLATDDALQELARIIGGLGEEVKEFTTQIHRTATGLTIETSVNAVTTNFSNNGVRIDNAGQNVAWFEKDSTGVPELQIGSYETQSRRWRIITSSDGKRLSFTRHS